MDQELIDVASRLVDLRTDDANHTTAAAARTAEGVLVTGMNVFHFTGGPCAELVVIGRAVAKGAGELVEIVAVGDGGRRDLVSLRPLSTGPFGLFSSPASHWFNSQRSAVGAHLRAASVG